MGFFLFAMGVKRKAAAALPLNAEFSFFFYFLNPPPCLPWDSETKGDKHPDYTTWGCPYHLEKFVEYKMCLLNV